MKQYTEYVLQTRDANEDIIDQSTGLTKKQAMQEFANDITWSEIEKWVSYYDTDDMMIDRTYETVVTRVAR